MKKLIEQLLNNIRAEIILVQSSLGMRTSGKSAKSIKVEATDESGSLTMDSSFYQQEHGRKPGKFLPPNVMLAWIKKKGITPRDPKTSLKSLAFLFNRKIAMKGTDIFLKKRPPLEVSKIIANNRQRFAERTKQHFVSFYGNQLVEKFEDINEK